MNARPGAIDLFVPGRLCLFGEHTDWAAEFGLHKGYCLIVGTDQGVKAEATASDSFTVETVLADAAVNAGGHLHLTCPWEPEALLAAARDQKEFFRYCAGAAYQVCTRLGAKGGVHLRIKGMDLPLKKGVSSSAAVCILVARSFDAVYRLGLFPHELMELAYLGERVTGSQCGRMDQAGVYGKTPVLLTFRNTPDVRVEPVYPGGEMFLFFVDLAGRKDTVKILADLRSAYVASPKLQQALGEENERIVRRAYRALHMGDAREFGGLMTLAQDVFDRLVAPHSPEELASPLLHQVLSLKDIAPHTYGGKGVGSQGDGTAQFVARSRAGRDAAMAKVTSRFPQMRCFPLTIRPERDEREPAHG